MIQLPEKQLKCRSSKAKRFKKISETPGMAQKLEQFEKRMKYYRGAVIVMNPKKNTNLDVLPITETIKEER